MASTLQDYDESDLTWDDGVDDEMEINLVCKAQNETSNEAASVPACISPSGSSHLMMLSLLEYICSLHIPDKKQSQKLFKVLCDEISTFDNMAPIAGLDEMKSIRTKYLTVFSSIMHNAVSHFRKNDRHLDEVRFNTFYAPSPSALQQLSLRNRRDSLSMNSSRYFNDFVECSRLGKGAFGYVYKVKSRLDGQFYAIKKIPLYQSMLDDWMRIIQESKILAGLKHNNVVGYHTAWLEFENKAETLGDGTSMTCALTSTASSRTQREDSVASESSNGIYFSDSASKIKTVNDSNDIERYQNEYRSSVSNGDLEPDDQLENYIKPENDDQCLSSRMDIEIHENCQTATNHETGSENHVLKLNLNHAELLSKLNSADEPQQKNIGPHKPLSGAQRTLADRCLALLDNRAGQIMVSESSRNLINQTRSLSLTANNCDELPHCRRSEICNIENRMLVQHGHYQSNVIIDYEGKCHVDVHNRVRHPFKEKEQVIEDKPRKRNRSGPKRSHSHDPSLDPESIERDRNEKLQLVSVQNSSSYLLRGQLNLYIQMELCDETLKDWIFNRNQNSTSSNVFDCVEEKMVNGLFVQILYGLQFIHSKGFIHRDIKPRNIFLNKSKPGKIPSVKIGDFGLATMLGMLESMKGSTVAGVHTAGVGTEPYASPEQIQGKRYDKKTDIYSLGVILFEMYHPFTTLMERADLTKNLPRMAPAFRKQWPGYCVMIEELMALKPANRPSIESMQTSEVFTHRKVKKSKAKANHSPKANKENNSLEAQVKRLMNENKKLKSQLEQKDSLIEILHKQLAAKSRHHDFGDI